MQSKLFRIVPIAVIAAILSFVLHTAFNLPEITAQNNYSGRNQKLLNTYAYEEISITGADVLSITSGIIRTTDPLTHRAYIQVTGQGIRWRCDGSDPSTSNGNQTSVADGWFKVEGLLDIQNFRAVNDDDTGTTVLHVNLQKQEQKD